MTAGDLGRHLRPNEVAAYAEGVLPADVRAPLQAHMASCAACRAEVADVLAIVEPVRNRHRMRRQLWMTAAAAAAVLLVFVWPRDGIDLREPQHRDAPVTATVAPRAVAPIGSVDTVPALVWASVPYADDYRVRLFDREGSVIWERETTDTVAAPSGAVTLRAGQPYYWRVEARTGFDRVASSDLVEFIPRSGTRP
jgi:anti-sigma factor RsiW